MHRIKPELPCPVEAIAIVVSDYHSEVTHELLDSCLKRLKELSIQDDEVAIVHVPGSIEIPLAAQTLSQSDEFDAVICLGAVIQDETDNYEYLCQQVNQGCQAVMLSYNIPVTFGVLTAKDLNTAKQRANATGIEAANSTLSMVSVLEQLDKE